MILNEQQLLPVNHTEGAVLVLAGAGSGKTRVLTARVAHLIKDLNVSPYEILAITFTNKAAIEMRERIVGECGTDGMWISTFHSFCAKILRIDGKEIGLSNNFTILDADDVKKILSRIYKEKKTDKNMTKAITSVIMSAKSFGIQPFDIREKLTGQCAEDVLSNAEEVYDLYEKEKAKTNSLDFDDLLITTVKLLGESKVTLLKYQQRFRYIHIDEFQDTNRIQYLLVKMLAEYHKNIFVVGDEDQGIYSWRGANIKNIISFKQDFENVAIYKLEQNYRSSANILKAANSVIKNNSERIPKTLWTNASGGVKVEIMPCKTDRSEAEYVVGKIAELIRYGKCEYKDIAILYRTGAFSRSFEEKLNLYNMPYKIFGGYKFFEREEIKTVNAYFRLACNPKDRDALIRVINFPARGIGDATVNKILEYSKNRDVDAIDVILGIDEVDFLPSATKNKIKDFRSVISELIANAGKLSPIDFAYLLMHLVPIKAAYEAIREKTDSSDKLENIATYFSSINEFSKDNRQATIIDYLQSVALLTDTDNVDDDNYIRLATVHSVKGLEFKTVFIVGLEQESFPSGMSINEGKLEEERRLMYVAITRAMERLTLTYCSSRFRYDGIRYYKKSCFIDEILADSVVVREKAEGEARHTAIQSAFTPKNKYEVDKVSQLCNVNKIVGKTTAKKDFSAFKPGVKVKHNKFGIGTIISVNNDIAAIAFDGLGIKKFSLEIAPLEVCND